MITLSNIKTHAEELKERYNLCNSETELCLFADECATFLDYVAISDVKSLKSEAAELKAVYDEGNSINELLLFADKAADFVDSIINL